MKIWKLSLGKNEFNNDTYKEMMENSVVSVHPDTKPKGQSLKSQGDNFLEAKDGELFFLCRSNDSIDLIGMFKDDLSIPSLNQTYANDGWKDRKFILVSKAIDNQNYNKTFLGANGKKPWWHPGDNSTFIEVKDLEIFEKEILNPVFNLTTEKLEEKVNQLKNIEELHQKKNLLISQKQIILQGPPGTGKTRLAKELARYIIKDEALPKIDDIKEQVKLIQFHPSYSYEDFVRGIVAKSNGTNIEYKTEDKILAKMAKEAQNNKDKTYILIIDEINRANLSSVLGELIYALEYRDEAVESMYEVDGSREIVLPSNLYIIGTMNTADRSTGYIDYAIRRRFTFVDVLPDEDVVHPESKFAKVKEIFEQHISMEFNLDDVMLGHSYFIADSKEQLKAKFDYQVIPLLKEYIKDGVLNESAKDAINEL